MIAEELLKIKSFGSDRKSAVTEEDMAQKEAELGFPLPAALRELYLCFHPDDPVFSEKGGLIPLGELTTYKRIYWTDTEVTILPFCRYERYGYGFEVGRHNKKQAAKPSYHPRIPGCGAFISSRKQTRRRNI